MNRFGRLAQDRWKALAPVAYAQLEDPSRHFSTLGEEAEKAWIDLADQLTGPDIGGESSWQKVGRINAAKQQAMEIIEVDWLTPPQERTETDSEDQGEKLDQTSARNMAIALNGDPEALADLGITLEVLGWTQQELDELRADLTSD